LQPRRRWHTVERRSLRSRLRRAGRSRGTDRGPLPAAPSRRRRSHRPRNWRRSSNFRRSNRWRSSDWRRSSAWWRSDRWRRCNYSRRSDRRWRDRRWRWRWQRRQRSIPARTFSPWQNSVIGRWKRMRQNSVSESFEEEKNQQPWSSDKKHELPQNSISRHALASGSREPSAASPDHTFIFTARGRRHSLRTVRAGNYRPQTARQVQFHRFSPASVPEPLDGSAASINTVSSDQRHGQSEKIPSSSGVMLTIRFI